MKRPLCLLAAMSLVYAANAQPQISAAEYDITLIDSVHYKYGSSQTEMQPGSAGANVTWDFSSLSLSSDLQYATQACPGSPLCGEVSDATEYFYGALASVFYKKTDQSWEQIGEKNNSGSLATFSDPYKFIQFPMSYQQTFTDAFAMSGADFMRQGTINSVIDGYGTLITPQGTYQNVLRQKLTETSTLSTQGAEINYTITQYFWYQANAHHQLATLISTESSIPDVPVPIPTTYVMTYSTSEGPSAIHETKDLQTSVNLYPNPATNMQFTITGQALTLNRIDLMDIMGKTVYSSDDLKGNTSTIILGNGIAAGIYAARIYTDKGVVSKKVVLQ